MQVVSNSILFRHSDAAHQAQWPAVVVAVVAACAMLGWQLQPPTNRPDRLPILMYHHIGDWGAANASWAPWVVKPADFAAQLDWLQVRGYHTITMAQLQAHREQGVPLPARPVMITIDDGWGEDVVIAQQFLQPRGMCGIFFVYTGAVGGSPFLSWPEVKALEASGHEVLSHTVSHPDLRQIPNARLVIEMRESRQRLEQELGHPVQALAYPFGLCDERVVNAARDAGYHLAVLAEGGNALDTSSALTLPRWKISYDQPLSVFVQGLQK